MAYDEETKYEVIDQGSSAYRQIIWDTASGLQEVDGLSVSAYANHVANSYISGEKTAGELTQEIETYYGSQTDEQSQADVVASRIVGMLDSGRSSRFELSGRFLLKIHAGLFRGQLEKESWVGSFRHEAITKREAVLGGRSVAYETPSLIRDALEYDFEQEKAYAYPKVFDKESVAHFADFVSGIWQIHPFREGNTRTSAVFAQLYLAQFGIIPGNDYFLNHGRWFRDALVRASYSSIPDGVAEDHSFIHAFFENIIFDAGNDLSSLDLNIHGIRVVSADYVGYRNIGDSFDNAVPDVCRERSAKPIQDETCSKVSAVGRQGQSGLRKADASSRNRGVS